MITFPTWKKTTKFLVGSAERVVSFSKYAVVGAGILLRSTQSVAEPRVVPALDPLASDKQLIIPTEQISKYSGKYVLTPPPSSLPAPLAQHASHSSHSSHASHYSGASGAAAASPVRPAAPSPVQPAAPTAWIETFSGSGLSSGKWKSGVVTPGASAFDSRVGIAERNGLLEIVPLRSTSGKHYSGYVSATPVDMTGAGASVEVSKAAVGSGETILGVAQDGQNWYRFAMAGGKLRSEASVAGAISSAETPYDASKHHFWRLRHDAATNLILWETSADGATWVVQHAQTAVIPIAAVNVELSAGTDGSTAAPGNAAFANFRLEPH
jgi:hypothetical protein